MKRETVLNGFFLGLFLLALYQFFVIVEPFLTPILGAMVLAIVAFPIHRVICRWSSRLNPSLQAALSTFSVTTLIVIPFATLVWLLLNESDTIVPLAQETVSHLSTWYQQQVLPWVDRILPLAHRIPFLSRLSSEHLQKASTWMSGVFLGSVSTIGRSLATNTLLTTLNLLVMIFALFFLLRDGKHVVERLKIWLPMQSRDKERILKDIEVTVLGVVRGSVLTALFQMLCATLGYFIVGVPAAVTLGLLTGMASVIPVVGTALVWLPTAIYLLVLSSAWKGVFLLLWGGVVIALMDNLVRTYLIGRNSRAPIFLLFLGLVGGLRVYGLRGLLIGPLLVAILPVLMDIFETQYLSDK